MIGTGEQIFPPVDGTKNVVFVMGLNRFCWSRHRTRMMCRRERRYTAERRMTLAACVDSARIRMLALDRLFRSLRSFFVDAGRQGGRLAGLVSAQ